MPRVLRLALLPVLFFVSGASALAGQVVLNRLLAYVFGASHLATSTVLAAYMGGLALGSLLAGRFVSRLRRPVRAYGLLELGVAAFFASLPALYPLLYAAGTGLSRALGAQLVVSIAVRFTLSFAFVLVPTVLMGATLPVLLSVFRDDPGLRRRLPWLYAANTLGGATGAFLSGYFLLYAIGLDGTGWLCAAANALVAAVALAVGRTNLAALESAPAPAPATAGEDGAWTLPPEWIGALAFAQGALSFSLEVTWSHLARTVIGVTTYAFTLMLTVILLGIGLGSLALALRHGRGGSALRTFVLAQAALAAAVAASLFAWDRFPDFVAVSLRHRYEWPFAGREALRFLFAVPLLLPAGIALGVSLPALTASLSSSARRSAGAWVGCVFAFNTLGAICGALLTGFVLLGRVPSEGLIRGGVVVALALAAAPWLITRRRCRPRALELALTAAALVLLALFPGWDRQRLTSGKHFMWDFYSPGQPDSVLFAQEDAQSGFVTVEKDAGGQRVMKTNGKYEGTDADAEFQDNFALMGALYLRRFEEAALLGLGPGRTLALLHGMPFRRVEVMEFSPAVLAAAKAEFGRVSGEALADRERVDVIVDDGRNHLQLSRRRYDYVVVGITAAAFAGVGSLYSRDFFEVVRTRLATDGVFLLWIQTHHVFPEDVRSVAFTLRSVFPHVHLYAVRSGQGFLVASASPLRIRGSSAELIGRSPRAARVLAARGLGSAVGLVRWNAIWRDEDLETYFSSTAIAGPPELYTDLSPRFEFTAPMGLATRILRYDFAPFASRGLPVFEPSLPPEAAAELERARDRELGRPAVQRTPAAGQSAASSSAN
jgi:spermidine synthase